MATKTSPSRRSSSRASSSRSKTSSRKAPARKRPAAKKKAAADARPSDPVAARARCLRDLPGRRRARRGAGAVVRRGGPGRGLPRVAVPRLVGRGRDALPARRRLLGRPAAARHRPRGARPHVHRVHGAVRRGPRAAVAARRRPGADGRLRARRRCRRRDGRVGRAPARKRDLPDRRRDRVPGAHAARAADLLRAPRSRPRGRTCTTSSPPPTSRRTTSRRRRSSSWRSPPGRRSRRSASGT